MILGHFAIGVATKPRVPTVPIWVLLLAPQALDVVFMPLVAVGVEGFDSFDYRRTTLDAQYSHSLVGAIIISASVFWIGKRFWNSNFHAWLLAGLSFSHWPLDLLVHHEDLPILPGNWGDFPLLGFALWDYPTITLFIEAILAVVAITLYFSWARASKTSSRWYLGPAIVAVVFASIALSDLLSA